MARWFAAIVLVAFSAGWLVPLYISGYCFWQWRQEVSPLGNAPQPKLNSFPYLQAAKFHWQIACFWLAVVFLFWVVVAARRSHYSLCALLVAVTLLAVLLGLGVWLLR